MDRRTLLAAATLGTAGLTLSGAVYDIRREDEEVRERSDCAMPDGPRRPLGRQQIIWSVPTRQRMVALTFDDGPDPEFTPRILDVLNRYEVNATFNVMGFNATRHTDLLRAIVDAGHELGTTPGPIRIWPSSRRPPHAGNWSMAGKRSRRWPACGFASSDPLGAN